MNLQNPLNEEFVEKTITDLQFENVIIENKKFDECIFRKCSFISCEIKNCTFLDCTFEDCVLSAAVPTNSRFIEVTWKSSKAIGIDWTKAKELRELSFKETAIDYSNFRFLDIDDIEILNSSAIETDFTEAKMKSSKLSGSDFKKAVFFKTDLTKADFRKAKNYNVDIQTNKLKKAQFSFPDAMNLLSHLDIKIDY